MSSIDNPKIEKTQKSTKQATIVSMFSGCGGMDLGFVGGFYFLNKYYKQTGFKLIWANEISSAACKTYRKNLGNHIVEGDINNELNNMPIYADIIIGGFPCQDISINGKMLGVKGVRSGLYISIVQAIRRIKPKVFVVENVGGLLLKQHRDSLNKILDDFYSLGYNLNYQPYNAEYYGVPQTRQRVIFVGTRKDLAEFIPPKPTCKIPISAKTALQDLESHPYDRDFSHIWSEAKASAEQGNRKLLADRAGYTIRAECHGNIQFHYSLPRRMSMREAARIQSFPDSFVFPCGLRETERQIGNAVPPVLAWHIANSIKSII
ncbi:DNA cytosine methyltransferase [Helicobacter macacae]|nr:DNA cytosine methyltransferase [Helicobacter macacae]